MLVGKAGLMLAEMAEWSDGTLRAQIGAGVEES